MFTPLGAIVILNKSANKVITDTNAAIAVFISPLAEGVTLSSLAGKVITIASTLLTASNVTDITIGITSLNGALNDVIVAAAEQIRAVTATAESIISAANNQAAAISAATAPPPVTIPPPAIPPPAIPPPVAPIAAATTNNIVPIKPLQTFAQKYGDSAFRGIDADDAEKLGKLFSQPKENFAHAIASGVTGNIQAYDINMKSLGYTKDAPVFAAATATVPGQGVGVYTNPNLVRGIDYGTGDDLTSHRAGYAINALENSASYYEDWFQKFIPYIKASNIVLWSTSLDTVYSYDLNEIAPKTIGFQTPIGYVEAKIDSDYEFANGGAFTNGIVTRPTAFNMGLMGEAGTEMIMPAAMMSDGSLGIHAIMPKQAANDSNGDVADEIKQLRAELKAALEALNRTAQANIKVNQTGFVQLIEENQEQNASLKSIKTTTREAAYG